MRLLVFPSDWINKDQCVLLVPTGFTVEPYLGGEMATLIAHAVHEPVQFDLPANKEEISDEPK